uniref:Uncharacterized protein n=1 Tax=Arundo donax TaxID=35708 RepID=A0A0A9FB68_ARUDO
MQQAWNAGPCTQTLYAGGTVEEFTMQRPGLTISNSIAAFPKKEQYDADHAGGKTPLANNAATTNLYYPTNNILLIIPPTEKRKVPNKSILTTEFKKKKETLLSPPDELILHDLHYHTPHDKPTGGTTAVLPRPCSR